MKCNGTVTRIELEPIAALPTYPERWRLNAVSFPLCSDCLIDCLSASVFGWLCAKLKEQLPRLNFIRFHMVPIEEPSITELIEANRKLCFIRLFAIWSSDR